MSMFEEILRRDEDSYFSRKFQKNSLTSNDWDLLWTAIQRRQEIDNKKSVCSYQTGKLYNC